MNDGYARKYDGKLLVRFDDTNPSKETSEFSEAILEDIKRLDITVDFMSHTSDHFDVIIEFARKFILDGFGYMDNTPVEQMRKVWGVFFWRCPSACRVSVFDVVVFCVCGAGCSGARRRH